MVAVTDLSSDVVLDISDLTDANGEQGLLGLAFHPTADLAYVDYTSNSGNTVVAEFAVDPITGVFDASSRREVLTVAQPYSNHNGGQLAFGPDQLLYIGLGDGGSGGDPGRRALDLGSRLGKILRIDPVAGGGEPFTVPADNPFVATAGADPTIWAYGLRNPWRFSFDGPTGDLWIADVGQNDWEEINRAVAAENRLDAGRGANFGWSAIEGFEPFNADQPSDGALDPLFVYDHRDGRCSVSGGAVARAASPCPISRAGTCSATTAPARSGPSTRPFPRANRASSRSPVSAASPRSLRAPTATSTPCRTPAPSPASSLSESPRSTMTPFRIRSRPLPRVRRAR